MNIEEYDRIKSNAILLYDKDQIEKSIDEIAKRLNSDYLEKDPIFIVVMKGGLIFAGKLLPKLSFPLKIDYCHASRYHDGIKGKHIEWKVEPQLDMSNQHVVILDDILDKGDTLREIFNYCMKKNVKSVKTAVLVEKFNGEKIGHRFRVDYCELKVPDKFIFGCGMDYNHYWRNFEEIYFVNNEVINKL